MLRRMAYGLAFIMLAAWARAVPASDDGGESGDPPATTYPGNQEEGTQLERRAVRAFQERRYAEAARLFGQAWEAYQHPRYQYNLGQCSRHAERWLQAVAAYRRRLELQPPPLNFIHAHIGYCLLRAGRREEANQALRRYLELEPSGDVAPQVRQALESGRWPEDAGPRPAQTVEAARRIHERADQLCEQAQFRQAAEAYMEGYRQHNTIHEFLMNASLCYLWARQVDQATETINQYLRTPSPDPEAYAILADCRETEGDLAAVLEAYRRYLQLAPDGDRALIARRVVGSLSRFDEMPTRQQATEAKQHLNRANQHAQAGRHNQAIRAYLDAWAGWPTPTIRFNLGLCYYHTRRYDEALTALTAYMEQMGDEGNYASVHLDIADVLVALDRNDEAMQHIRTFRRRAEAADLPREDHFLSRSREIEEACKED